MDVVLESDRKEKGWKGCEEMEMWHVNLCEGSLGVDNCLRERASLWSFFRVLAVFPKFSIFFLIKTIFFAIFFKSLFFFENFYQAMEMSQTSVMLFFTIKNFLAPLNACPNT